MIKTGSCPSEVGVTFGVFLVLFIFFFQGFLIADVILFNVTSKNEQTLFQFTDSLSKDAKMLVIFLQFWFMSKEKKNKVK